VTDSQIATVTKSRLALRGLAILILIDTIGGVAVRNVIGWPAFIVVSTLLTAAAIWMLMRIKPAALSWHNLPKSLLAFLGLAILSIAWSAYRFESLLGVLIMLATTTVAVSIAFALTFDEFVRTLATSLKYLLLGSVLFELFVSLFIRQPVYIWWVDAPEEGEKPLKLLMMSRDLLFEGGAIQGLFGSSTLLGFTALLGLIVFGVQLFGKTISQPRGWFWVSLSVALIALTRSATVTVALIAVIVALGFALWARRLESRNRTPLYVTATALILAGVGLVVFARDWLFSLLGKSSDLTGRLETWQKVNELAEQRSAFGWGYISYWAPWVEPFKSLDTKNGIQVMHAHNAWLDVWLQLGVIGLILFALIVFSTFWRTWFFAVDRPRRFVNETLPFTTQTLVPFLILVALIVQSLTESRLLIEGGWVLLVALSAATRTSVTSETRDLSKKPSVFLNPR
jgi:exopolysaccharide production protein ExoQ